jgi:aryl-alcohol dehydrogenase-like predicted oxidoreductase
LADHVGEIAKEIQTTPVKVALAWLQSRDVTAIPGTRKIERLEENWASQDITLGTEHLKRLDALIQAGVVGDRY